ncbi:MAG: D-beta-D-heptose 7-phosphate kinase / D-beta-D-heptose 1-phosphate adenosyltransferase [Alphaproteobacteria bacterium]|nr:D-beta-D-heptose 7-phosphate kinase / D-beta-D-heptose 1-phosphate adenosyltransferase [Alphaproteobacteria bacterium]
MHDVDQQLAKFADATVLCIGDLMLDDFVYGEVTRISPEAPAPVIAVTREEKVIGGAGNVARGIAALGAQCIFVGVLGQDEAARILSRGFIEDCPTVETHLVVDPARPTTRKVRFVSEHHSTHLLRADWEVVAPVSAEIERSLINAATAVLPRADSVVLSDYAKGVLGPRVIRTVIEAARKLGKPVIVDPKGQDFAVYRGATLITPNRKELAEAVRRALANEADIAAAAQELARMVESEAVLVTRSEAGMTLYRKDGGALHVPAYPVKVRDVSGAGDTVAAVLAVMLATGAEFEPSVRAANAAAAVVVGKRGTATVSAAELRSRLLPAASLAPEEKIVFDWSVLDERLAEWREQDLRVGFTNGCFDLLHPGHVKLLTQARAACDRLVVGLNSDASVTRLKGEGRPVQHERARAEVLAALEAVDLVVVFGQDTPLELLRRVRPKVLVKGADYSHDQVVGHELVEADGGRIVLVDLAPDFSTTGLVKRVRSPAGEP